MDGLTLSSLRVFFPLMSDDKFSVGLRLNDLDDFITPSQACVSPAQPSSAKGDQKRAKIELTDEGLFTALPFSLFFF